MTTRLLTVTDAAEQLACSRGHVYSLIATGQLRPVDIKPTSSTRSKTRLLASEVEEFIRINTRDVVAS